VPEGTLTQLLFEAVDRFGSRPAFRTIVPGGFQEISYLEFLDKVRRVSRGLEAMGIARGEKVAILAENRPEWSQTDFGALCSGVPMVPIHTTLTPRQIAYILRDSEARAVFVSDEEQAGKVGEALELLGESLAVVSYEALESDSPHIVHWDEFLSPEASLPSLAEFREEALSARPGDPANIIYTSGTTGDPKGVVLTHNNLYSNVRAVGMAVHVDESDSTLSFLPLSHVFQRMVDLDFFSLGATITYARSLKTVAEDLRIARPTKVAGAPRVFEKIYQTVMEQPGYRGFLVRWAREVGEAWAEEKLAGREPTLVLRWVHRLAHALVFKKIHDAVGGRLIFFFSGSAPLAPHITRFFYSAGIRVLEGYGLTETSPGIAMTSMTEFKIGTVGPPIPGTELRIADDGEILVKGPQVMKEYYRRPEETRAAFADDRWFRTGDIGEITDEGYLTITDRKKNILVTSGGKNVAPAPIENLIKESRYVDQVVLIGDGMNFPALLVVPDFEGLARWAEREGVPAGDRRALLGHTRVQEHLGREILGPLDHLASYERPKKIGLIHEEFTIEGGILTPNQKVKRRVVGKRYGRLIERLYDPANRHLEVLTEEEME